MMVVYSPGFGSDGGGWWIDQNGFHRIPPWNPEVVREVEAALAIAAASVKVKDAKLSAQLLEIANKMIVPHVAEIERQAGKLSK